jgi:O-antigen ligase/Flp pilus assembly protein TadD
MAKTKPRRARKTTKRAPFEWRLDRLLVYGIALTLFGLPLFISSGITEYGYGKTIVALIAISILSILWAVDAWRKGTWTIRIPWIAGSLLAFVVASLFSLLHAVNGRVVIQSLTLFVFFGQLFLLIVNAVRERRDVTLLLFSFLASMSLISLYSLLQYLGLVAGPTTGTGLRQVISTLGNREYVAGALCYALFPALILVFRLRSRVMRGAALLLIVFNFGTLQLVRQTGATVALIVAALALIIGWLIFRPVDPVRRLRRWLIAALVLLALAFLIEARSGPLNSVVGLSADGSSWITRIWTQNSGNVRAWDWWIGLEMFKAHPLFGVGLGNYKLQFIPYKVAFLQTPQGQQYDFAIPRAAQAHNEYVQTLAETGVFGILSLLSFLVLLAVGFWIRLRRNPDEDDRMDLLLLAAGLVAVLVHALVSFPAHLPVSSLAALLTLGLAWAPVYGSSATWSTSLRGWGLKALAVVIAVVGVTVSVIAVRDLEANVLMGEGIQQLQFGQTQQAVETLQKSERLDFAPRQTYFYLASAYVQLGDNDAAINALELCFTRFVDESVYLTYAELAASAGQTAQATEKLDVLLASEPNKEIRTKARYIQATISIREADYARAMTQLQSLTTDVPDFEAGWIALGNLDQGLGHTEDAQRDFQQALDLIKPKLAKAEKKLAGLTHYTAEEYATLRSTISTLRSEQDYVLGRLDEISTP